MKHCSKFRLKWKGILMTAEGITWNTWLALGFFVLALRLPELIRAIAPNGFIN